MLNVDMQKQINLRNLDSISNMPVSLKGDVWWQEIPTTEQGRLFVSIDGHLSNDAFYINTHYASGSLGEYQQVLKHLIKEVSEFKHPLMRIDIRPDTMAWPSHEPLNLIVEITNHGPVVNELEMVMNLPDSFEPMGTIERAIPQLRRFAKTSFTLPVIPRVDGLFQNVITATARSSERVVISLIFSPTSIKVMPNVETNLRPQARQDDLGLSALQSTFRLLSGFPEIQNLPSLVVVDPHACLNKMRIIAEKLAIMVLTKQKVPLTKDFNAAIQTLQRSHLLSNRAIGYLHTTRTIGNLASHPSYETLSEVDVRIVSYALASVAEEVNRRKLI